MSNSDLCEQFCSEPIGPDGERGDEDFRSCCPACRVVIDWLCDEVLPSIRKNGYYAPPEADVDAEFAAMKEQAKLRPQLRELLSDLGINPDGDIMTRDGGAG